MANRLWSAQYASSCTPKTAVTMPMISRKIHPILVVMRSVITSAMAMTHGTHHRRTMNGLALGGFSISGSDPFIASSRRRFDLAAITTRLIFTYRYQIANGANATGIQVSHGK